MPESLTRAPRPAERVGTSEKEFYSFYEWCLNPVLSLRELLDRLGEELDRFEGLRIDWQRDECRINLYLFTCAIACSVDDYLAWRPWNLAPIVARIPRCRRGAALAQSLLNSPWSLRSLVSDRSIVRWRRRWGRCVDHVCGMLVGREIAPAGAGSDAGPCGELRTMVRALSEARLPPRLLRQRMRLPEGFRCQDLTHHDVVALARRFASSAQDREKPLVIIGPRTAGAYFAPLVRAYLEAHGWPRVSWMTIRPKMGVSRREWRQLRRLTAGGVRVLVVDDHPNTGTTFRLILDVLRRLRVPAQRITIVAPRHPAGPDGPRLKETVASGEVSILTLEPDELYKARVLEAGWVEARMREYSREWDDVRIQGSPEVDAVNARLWKRYGDGFQVRLKRLFRVQLGRDHEPPIVHHVFAKSVGWGWLGYHAYIAGTRLGDCVPGVVGLREGLLLTEWVGEVGRSSAGLSGSERVHAVSSYVARRVQRLRLAGDPAFASAGYRWNGWDEIVALLRGAYGRWLGRLKVRALRRQLRQYVSPVPTLVDGQMRPEEWIQTPTGIRKVDFEHHNFGGGEKDIVDPAWDLASAIFELALSEQEERDLLHAYARKSGDRTITDRILLYQLLYGVHSMNRATSAMARGAEGPEQVHWNRRYLRARNFLVHRLNRFHAGVATDRQVTRWSNRLFFLDLDGVFDCERFGFPHTTSSGTAALALLRAHDFSIVLNTGRSVGHVRDYCGIYGLPGGLAEFGSVFVDAVNKRELPLISREAAEQVARCRDAIHAMPGVSVDEGYRYSVRGYRWQGSHTTGLDAGEAQALLARCHGDQLTIIARREDTYLVQKGISKGSALVAVKKYLGCPHEPVVAMGDSDQDLEALEIAEFGYAPANCSRAVRELARRGGCRVMRQPFQKGLLAAARDVLAHDAASNHRATARVAGDDSGDLMRVLSHVAERSRLRQFVAVLDWRGL